LFDLKARLDERQIYLQSEIDALANVYFNPATRMNVKTQSMLYRYIDPAVDRYNAIAEDAEKKEFKKSLRTWTNLYSFLAQITDDVDLGKPAELVALSVKERAARCRLLESKRVITLRASRLW
jgi:type I restriction enzyme R subunit